MLTVIPNLLGAADVQALRRTIDAGDWVDGNVTSGHQSALAKRNLQLAEDGEAARTGAAIVLDALGRSPLFIAAALPLRIYPPLFNSYAGGQTFGVHVDNSVRIRPGTDFRVRSDLSATLFLEDADAYDGGELVIEGQFGAQTIKLPAGHMVLYPSSSLHRVNAVTRGRRVASFFWVQSMVRDDGARAILFDLDRSVQALGQATAPDDPSIVRLTGVYHNLLRRWADA